jgi:beta-phosphoglucomutase
LGTQDFRYDSVIFDVGGTLLGFYDWVPFQEFLAEVGLPAAEDDARRFHRRFVETLVARRDGAQGLGSSQVELDRWWTAVFHAIWPDAPHLAQAMFDAFRADRFDRVFPDVVPALDALRELGFPLAVLSNFTPDLENLLRRLGLRDYFGFVIVSALVGLAKPDSRVFDLAVARSGLPRRRLLYVGDHVGDDIHGAWAAGIDAVLIDRGDRQAEAACPRIRSLLDLVPYVGYPTRPAKAILFDLDGVVLDSLAAHLAAWEQTLAPLGIHLTRDDLAPLEGMPTAPMAIKFTELFLGRACSHEEAARLAAIKRALFLRLLDPRPIPGIVPLLHNLRGRGYRLALVTGNSGPAVAHVLSALGLDGLFELRVTAEDTSRGKPDPEPYSTAAARLNLPPADCLVVENAPLGLQSATAAGMRCVALATTLPASRLAAADQVFADVKALAGWLLSPVPPLPSASA